ncbi:hypothetical protein IVB27_32610 [Bradyrhizobium sp. 197]|uniref:hypothetical protein n=1 Tax=Bradyrhizobium sp. 197 TaxID=2782663 RepID=UPI001FF90F65|nr:hypothetical protein [Bradyrhizobium sp. 197]MCK1479358.1 hypothetical protein [Bradyrhizobium sp. 197]
MTQPLKTGTRIEFFVSHPQGRNEMATIARWTKVSGPRMDGWHIVKFADGGKLCVHETGFRVIDNRIAA